MKHTSNDTLTKLADDLADHLRTLDRLGAPGEATGWGFLLVGMLYSAARHPELSPVPIPKMIADADRAIAAARDAIARNNR